MPSRARHHGDLVAGTDVALAHDAEVGTEARGVVEAIDELGVAHADPELEARLPGLRHLELGAPDQPAGPDHQRPQVDAFDGQVLAERAGLPSRAELAATTTRSPRPRRRRPPCRGRRGRAGRPGRRPTRFTPRTATRPSTGAFQIPVVTVRPCHSTVRTPPTFTDTTRAIGAVSQTATSADPPLATVPYGSREAFWLLLPQVVLFGGMAVMLVVHPNAFTSAVHSTRRSS